MKLGGMGGIGSQWGIVIIGQIMEVAKDTKKSRSVTMKNIRYHLFYSHNPEPHYIVVIPSKRNYVEKVEALRNGLIVGEKESTVFQNELPTNFDFISTVELDVVFRAN
jgi:hypothetical protein